MTTTDDIAAARARKAVQAADEFTPGQLLACGLIAGAIEIAQAQGASLQDLVTALGGGLITVQGAIAAGLPRVPWPGSTGPEMEALAVGARKVEDAIGAAQRAITRAEDKGEPNG
jgi:hypothetical protein